MWWVLKVLVGVISILISQSTVYASSDIPDWSDYKIHSKSFNTTDRTLGLICGGEVRVVSIAYDPQPRKGCGYGNDGGVKFIQFTRDGQLLSAISQPSDSRYYILRNVCTVISYSCVYSQSTDSLLQKRQTGTYTSDISIIKDLTKKSKRSFDPATMGYYYSLNASVEALDLGRSTPISIGSMAVSSSGRWMVTEAVGLGLIRVDMQTLEHRRISTLSSQDIQFRFSITDDGSFVALSSERSMASVVSVDSSCGDRLSDESYGNFPGYVRRCNQAALYLNPDFEQYFATINPYFIDPGHLLVTVQTRLGSWEVVIIPSSTPPKSKMLYVALGDSFSSGEGEVKDDFYLPNTNNRPHSCHVSSRSYPYLIEPIPLLGLGDRLNVACSGAVIKDIVGSSNYRGQGSRTEGLSDSDLKVLRMSALSSSRQGILPQVDFIKEHTPELVSIGIGGNDAGFMGKLKSCLAPDTCDWAKPGESRGAVAAEIDALYDKYVSMVSKVRQVSPESRLILIGYPKIISELQNANCDLLTGTMLNYDERIFIARSTERLNSIIRAVAATTGVEYVQVQEVYGDSKLCGPSDTPSMNGVRLGDDFGPSSSFRVIGAESFHPTPRGHSLVAREISRYLQYGVAPVSTRHANVSYENEEYWTEGVEDNSLGRYILLDSDNSIISLAAEKQAYSISLKAGTFEPGSVVSLQVDDLIAEYPTNSDGSLLVDIKIPKNYQAPVFTVFIRGVSVSGENIITYALLDSTDMGGSVGGQSSSLAVKTEQQPQAVSGRPNTSIPEASVLGSNTVKLSGTPLVQVAGVKSTQNGAVNSHGSVGGHTALIVVAIGAALVILATVAVLVHERRN